MGRWFNPSIPQGMDSDGMIRSTLIGLWGEWCKFNTIILSSTTQKCFNNDSNKSDKRVLEGNVGRSKGRNSVVYVLFCFPPQGSLHQVSPKFLEQTLDKKLMSSLRVSLYFTQSVNISFFYIWPLLHNWCNKRCGMDYPVCGMVHINDSLLLIGKSRPVNDGSRFHLFLSKWSVSNSI